MFGIEYIFMILFLLSIFAVPICSIKYFIAVKKEDFENKDKFSKFTIISIVSLVVSFVLIGVFYEDGVSKDSEINSNELEDEKNNKGYKDSTNSKDVSENLIVEPKDTSLIPLDKIDYTYKNDEVLKYVTNSIDAHRLVRYSKIENNILYIDFYDNYEQYFSENNGKKYTEDNNYFSLKMADKRVVKLIALESTRILREFPGLSAVSINASSIEGYNYSIFLDRKSLNNKLGFNIEQLNPYNDSWRELFILKYFEDINMVNYIYEDFIKIK